MFSHEFPLILPESLDSRPVFSTNSSKLFSDNLNLTVIKDQSSIFLLKKKKQIKLILGTTYNCFIRIIVPVVLLLIGH